MEKLEYLRKADKRLSKVIDRVGIIEYQSYNHSENGFEFLVHEIVGQMISARVRKVLYNRLLVLCSDSISPKSILTLSFEELRSIGLSRSKSEYIVNLATLANENKIDFPSLSQMSDEVVIKKLTAIKGIGNWTAKMYLMFYLQREDILPYEDGAFLQAYKWLYNTNDTKAESIVKRCKKWKPYTSVGARYLYRALDTGLTKIPIKEFLDK